MEEVGTWSMSLGPCTGSLPTSCLHLLISHGVTSCSFPQVPATTVFCATFEAEQ